jgi:hypothetical protein
LYELNLMSVFSMPFEIVSNILSKESIRLGDEDSLPWNYFIKTKSRFTNNDFGQGRESLG